MDALFPSEASTARPRLTLCGRPISPQGFFGCTVVLVIVVIVLNTIILTRVLPTLHAPSDCETGGARAAAPPPIWTSAPLVLVKVVVLSRAPITQLPPRCHESLVRVPVCICFRPARTRAYGLNPDAHPTAGHGIRSPYEPS
eukprot:SAG11_NODE_10260_length_843_cov_1.485215_1_plen_141_part_01